MRCPCRLDTKALPSMDELLGQHVRLKAVKKIGEGTFGEAFKSGDVVFKIVPMEGGSAGESFIERTTLKIVLQTWATRRHPGQLIWSAA